MKQHPENRKRAKRGEAALKARIEAVGEHFNPRAVDYLEIASLLADIRHYCDAKDIDYYRAEGLSYEHYSAEKAGAA